MLTVTKSLFPDSDPAAGRKPVYAYKLENDNGMSVTALTYGGIISDVRVPDRLGRIESVVLGFDDLKDYAANPGLYFGAIVGRTAGRITKAKFHIGKKKYKVPANENGNALHGNGEYSTAYWNAQTLVEQDRVLVSFEYTSPDDKNGYPGEVKNIITYALSQDNNLTITYEAASDETTVLNLTNHTYFNLSGGIRNDVTQHHIKADFPSFLELGEGNLPTGNILPAKDTPFDFSGTGHPIYDGVASEHPQNVLVKNGYDHPFVFDKDKDHTLVMSDPASGRILTLTTDYPVLVMYTGNYIDSSVTVRNVPGMKYMGVALEAQLYPDAMNHPDTFEPYTLEAGKAYSHSTTWSFKTDVD